MEIPIWLASILVTGAMSMAAYCAKDQANQLRELNRRMHRIEGHLGLED